LVLAAPPCDQFTKANSAHWEKEPRYFHQVANRCFQLCIWSGCYWVLENPPGRIENFIPELKKFRQLTYQDRDSNKEYVLYSNRLLISAKNPRYGKNKNIHAWDKSIREMWTPSLVDLIKNNFNL